MWISAATLVLAGVVSARTPAPLIVAATLLMVGGGLVLVITAARIRPQTRPGLILLGAGVVLWSIGSASLNSGPAAVTAQFPGPGEIFFLSSVVALLAGVLITGSGMRASTLHIVTDTTLVVSSVAAFASLLIPLIKETAFGAGWPLDTVLAGIYPLLNAVIAGVVGWQTLTGRRARSGAAVLLASGFAVLAAADGYYMLYLSTGVYDPPAIWVSSYGLAWAGIITATTRTTSDAVRKLPPHSITRPGALLAGFAAALGILGLLATRSNTDGTLVPALVGLGAVGVRFAVTLRETQHALALAHTDDLTGIANRRAFTAALTTALLDQRPVAVLLLDLDHFKTINDTHGHDTGDHVLATIATRLARHLGPPHLVARLGGDEFVILLHDTSLGAAHDIGNELTSLTALAITAPGPLSDHTLHVGATIGIALATPSDRTISDILRRADSAMYEKKNA